MREALDALLIAFVFYVVVVITLRPVSMALPVAAVSLLYLLKGLYLDRDEEESERGRAADWLLLAFVGTEALNYFTSSYKANSFYSVEQILFLLLFYTLVRGHLRTDRQQQTLYWFVTLLGCALAAATVYEYRLSYLEARAVGFDDASEVKQALRTLPVVGAPAGETYTLLLALLPFPLALLARRRRAVRLCLLVAVALILMALALSFSRGLYLAAAVFFVAAGLLITRCGILPPARLVRSAVAVALLTLVALLPFAKPVMTTASAFGTVSQVRSLEGRGRVWVNSLDLARSHLLFGVGANNFAMQYAAGSGRSEAAPFVGRPYNIVLQVLVERGLVGLVAYSLLALLLLLLSFKKIRAEEEFGRKLTATLFTAAFLALLVRDASYSSLLTNKGVGALLCLMLAVNSQSRTRNAEPGGRSRQTFRPRLLRRAPALTLCLTCFCVGAERLRMDEAQALFRASVARIEAGDVKGAEVELVQASSLNPDSANILSHQALLRYRTAFDELHPASLLRGHVVLGDAERRQLRAAVSAYLAALRLSPHDDVYQHNVGWLLWLSGDQEGALSFFRRAIESDPGAAPYRVSLGLLLEHRGDADGARREYAAAVSGSPGVLDSRFFHDLRERAPSLASAVLDDGVASLERGMAAEASPLTKAKLAKLYLERGAQERARKLLDESVRELPNLSRPWFSLGLLHGQRGDRELMEAAFARASFLDRSYVAPVLALGALRAGDGRMSEAVNYYREAVARARLLSSDHATRVSRIYYAETTVRNDLIPSDLLAYCKAPYGMSVVGANFPGPGAPEGVARR